jgi:hypothetical protein
MSWQPMETAPKDGTVIEVLSLNFGKPGRGTTVYKTRWASRARKWLNWSDLSEELEFARKWRPAQILQPRQWTDDEERTLARIHRPEGDRFIPFEEYLAAQIQADDEETEAHMRMYPEEYDYGRDD